MKLPNLYTNGEITININELKRRCLMPIGDFANEIPLVGEIEKTTVGSLDSRYFFRNNGSKVLAVAHLDTAMWITDVEAFMYNKKPLIFSPQLDKDVMRKSYRAEYPARSFAVFK